MGFLDPKPQTTAGLDAAVTAKATTGGTALNAALNATFVPKWKATTAYLAGDAVLSPAGDTVTAIANFTSGASFNAANWNYSPTYVGKKNLKPGALASLKPTLLDGNNAAIQVISDSTGSGATRWPYLLGQLLATSYSGYTILHRQWNDTSQAFDAPTTIQTGTAGDQFITFTGAGNSVREYGDGTVVSGDLDVRAKIMPDSWTDASATAQTIIARFGGGGARAFRFQINGSGSGKLYFDWTADGSTLMPAKLSTVALPFANGTAGWVRVVLDVDNGSAGHDVKFYTSTDGASWTQLGTTVTTAGTTGLFNPASQYYEVGGRGDTAELFRGRVYEGSVHNGIDGLNVISRYPREWIFTASTFTISGAPILNIVNGSRSGGGQSYFTDTTRLPKMTPYGYRAVVALLSCSHNDGYNKGRGYWAAWDNWLSTVKSRLSGANVVYVSQNPRVAPADVIQDHKTRRTEGMQWASRNALSYVDVFQSFMDSPLGLASLVQADGIHPTDATGSPLWRDAVMEAINARV